MSNEHSIERTVSVIMPAHAPRSDWFAMAVSSVLDDPAVLELIVVDDGTEPPLRPPVDDTRIVMLRSHRSGTYRARDVGLEHARGRFIRFFDADDVCVSGSTSRLATLVAKTDDRIAYGTTVISNEELAPLRTTSEAREGDVSAHCLLGEFDVYHVSMVYPAWCVRAAGAFEAGFQVSGDWDFVLRALDHCPVVHLDETVTLYRRSTSSITGQTPKELGAAARRRIIDRYVERNPDADRSLARAARASTDLDLARWHAAAGRRWRMRWWQLRAVAHHPTTMWSQLQRR
jgi:glycosyltransferase involved in cell wall biosynthesis